MHRGGCARVSTTDRDLTLHREALQDDELVVTRVDRIARSIGDRQDIVRERQMEGIAKAEARGVYKGHKPTVDAAERDRRPVEGQREHRLAGAAEGSRRHHGVRKRTSSRAVTPPRSHGPV